jgi:serine/threonine protein kinase
VDLARRFDLAYRMRVLHNTAKGLNQLHVSQIAHQDIKPSNVVTFDRISRDEIDTTKIARSSPADRAGEGMTPERPG